MATKNSPETNTQVQLIAVEVFDQNVLINLILGVAKDGDERLPADEKIFIFWFVTAIRRIYNLDTPKIESLSWKYDTANIRQGVEFLLNEAFDSPSVIISQRIKNSLARLYKVKVWSEDGPGRDRDWSCPAVDHLLGKPNYLPEGLPIRYPAIVKPDSFPSHYYGRLNPHYLSKADVYREYQGFDELDRESLTTLSISLREVLSEEINKPST